MRLLRRVDVSALAAALPQLDWRPAGDPGTFAMIERFPPEVASPVDAILAEVFNDFPARVRGICCLSRLTPGQFIEPHFDRHNNYCKDRVHIPIVTNPGAVFVSGKRAVHMKTGEAWVIDPSVVHCVANGGATDRVHLFCNLVIQ